MKTINFIIKSVFLMLAMATTHLVYSQIPNPSFEEWENILYYDEEGATMYRAKPVNWDTNQSYSLERLQQDTDSYDGDFSLKLVDSGGNPWGGVHCWSQVLSEVSFSNPLESGKSLYFYYKTMSNNDDGTIYFNVKLLFYQDGDLIGEQSWNTEDEVIDYTLAEIPLLEGIDSIEILIKGSGTAGPTDSCINQSIIWVDNLHIEDSGLSTKEALLVALFYVFPNPVEDILYIKKMSTINLKKLTVYDVLGKEVVINMAQNRVDVSHLQSGVYFLKIDTDKGEIIKKLVKN